eukprot:COSAG01_NODE_33866_length_557_cov_0.914847_2_plen_68_part_01
MVSMVVAALLDGASTQSGAQIPVKRIEVVLCPLAQSWSSKVDAPELSSGPGWEIQEVSRVGAQGVTSK